MKRVLSIVLVASLAGCFNMSERISTMQAFGGQPVVKASVQVRGGPIPTTKDVLAVQKPLRVSKVRNNSLTCYDYLLSSRDGGAKSKYSDEKQKFYVAFNLNNEVVDRGYMDCNTYDQNPNAHWWVE
ncbi:hypothetical protein GR157_04810 [Burkholderia sp. 4701]|nr:hypothetical protein [Burkholderia sp. 4701]MXN80347.1 hypothetical protein [Burkholderia sp. 4812]